MSPTLVFLVNTKKAIRSPTRFIIFLYPLLGRPTWKNTLWWMYVCTEERACHGREGKGVWSAQREQSTDKEDLMGSRVHVCLYHSSLSNSHFQTLPRLHSPFETSPGRCAGLAGEMKGACYQWYQRKLSSIAYLSSVHLHTRKCVPN